MLRHPNIFQFTRTGSAVIERIIRLKGNRSSLCVVLLFWVGETPVRRLTCDTRYGLIDALVGLATGATATTGQCCSVLGGAFSLKNLRLLAETHRF